MSYDEISRQIWEICSKNASDENQAVSPTRISPKAAEASISSVLANARRAAKHSPNAYEHFRRQLCDAASNHVQYETALKTLSQILCI